MTNEELLADLTTRIRNVTPQYTARDPEMLIVGALTRDADGALISGAVRWPDGTPGTYTGTASTAFPGRIDSYTITYGSPVIKTYTQPAVTRDANGIVTNVPEIGVS